MLNFKLPDMKKVKLALVLLLAVLCPSCKDYLDVVPDNVATIDIAFSNSLTAEQYLFTCYSYIPGLGDSYRNIGLFATDELWMRRSYLDGSNTSSLPESFQIALGFQNVNDPYMNLWDGMGKVGGMSLFKGIRDCNIFLENLRDDHKVSDITYETRNRWIAEAEFLKAYFHFYLFRMYGPIPIVDKNLPVSSSIEETKYKRQPADSVVNYISRLLDKAIVDLPARIVNLSTEYGRIDKAIAASVKAQLWITAASPLFNGNPDYNNFVDKDGTHLFSTAYDPAKWDSAVTACELAANICEANGITLYKFDQALPISDQTKVQLSIRNSLSARENNVEVIWPLTKSQTTSIQNRSMARLDSRYDANFEAANDLYNPTLNIASLFYTDHGVPIEEDKTWDYDGRFAIREATADDRYNLIPGYEVSAFHFNREPGFYADLGFDGGVWYMQNSPSGSDENTWTVKAREGGPQAAYGIQSYSVTGYWPKKIPNWEFVIHSSGYAREEYAWPEIRLTGLYLLYAEALNEVGRGEDAIRYLDRIRERNGLKGVKESWSAYSTNPDKFSTQAGLREIIHRQRAIDLVFEGKRYWDLLRWKEAPRELNGPVWGWNINSSDAATYYQPRVLYFRKFVEPRDYFSPIREQSLIENPNLVQNPGW